MSNEEFLQAINTNNPQLLEDLKEYLIFRFGSQLPPEILTNPDTKDQILAIWNFVRTKGLDEEIKVASIQEVTKNYLLNKNTEKIPQESFSQNRLRLIRSLLKFKTSSPILELPDSVDKLVALGLTQDQAYDLMIENFFQELGITRAVLPKYYEAVQTINKYAKDKKLDITLGKRVLDDLKIRATVLKVTWSEKAEVFEPVAAAFTNSEEAWREVISFDYKKFYTGGELSVQEMFDNPLFSIVSDYGKGKFKDAAWNKLAGTKIGQTVIEKIGINAASKTAVTTATTTATTTTTAAGTAAAGATAGTAIAPIVGTFIGFVAGLILPKIQEGLSIFQRFVKKNPEVFGAITLGASFVPFGLSPILGGAIGYGGGHILKGGFGEAGASFARGVNTLSTGLVDAVGTEIVWPIVVIIISVPIVIALILFIITNSALVVPYDSSRDYFGGNPAFSTVAGSCPLESGIPSCFSYESNQSCRHGSDSYWFSQGVACRGEVNSICKRNTEGVNIEMCLFEVPYIPGVCRYSSNPTNTCYQSGNTCSGYGRALDVSATSGTPVFLPEINNKKLDWQFVSEISINNGLWGYGKTFTASDDSNTYELYLGHLNKGGSGPGTSGKNVGSLHCINDCNQAHVHIELKINGINVIPDGLCKK